MTGGEHIPLAKPAVGEREQELVSEVLRSGRLSLGSRLAEFEARFAERLGAENAVAVSSGTAGLHLSVRAAGVVAGDEVVTSPLSFVASANCILYEGARPVFVDIDRETLNIDPRLVEAAITERTRAILPVHLFGYPADLVELEKIAMRHDLAIVEDACEALGAVAADGARVGASGNLAVFGFYPNKQMTTGEGGMVTLGNKELAERIRSERNQGRAPDMGWLDHERLGFNYRLDEIACALGIAQLEKLDRLLARRAAVAGWYRDRLDGVDGLTLPCADRGVEKRSWFVFVIQLSAETDRGKVIEGLANSGIASKPYMPAIHLQPYMQERFGFKEGDFPVTEDVAARSLALPFFPEMTEAQVDRVSESVRALCGPMLDCTT